MLGTKPTNIFWHVNSVIGWNSKQYSNQEKEVISITSDFNLSHRMQFCSQIPQIYNTTVCFQVQGEEELHSMVMKTTLDCGKEIRIQITV